MREDARRNRERLIEAATEVFSEQGLGASLGEVARRAGVGEATLYRRFPARADLYAAVYEQAQETIRGFGEEALRVEDGWAALYGYLERACEFAGDNRAVADLMVAGAPDGPSPVDGWERNMANLTELVDRARRQGSLRPEVSVQDVLVALYSVDLMIAACAGVAPEAWRRQLAFTMNGLRAAGPLAERGAPSLTREQLAVVAARLFLRQSPGDYR